MSQVKSDIAASLQQGLDFHRTSQLAKAQAIYENIIAIVPTHFDALHLLGVSHSQLGNDEQALHWIDLALQVNPQIASAHSNRGNAFRGLKRSNEALTSFDRAVALEPQFVDALYNRGGILNELGRKHDAVHSYDRAIALQPNHASSLYRRGLVFQDLGLFNEAAASLRRAASLNPNYCDGLLQCANLLSSRGQYDHALDCYKDVIELRPQDPEALCNSGAALQHLGRTQEALSRYELALALNPSYADALNNRGAALWDLRCYDEALSSGERALALKPDYEFLFGVVVHTRQKICDWTGIDAKFAEVSKTIMAGDKASPPFFVLGISSSLELQKKSAVTWVQSRCPADPALSAIGKRPRREKICLGYFSSDFRNHALSSLLAEMFEKHDRSLFEVVAFAFGPDSNDEIRARLRGAFDLFLDVGKHSDKEIAQLCRKMEIDIAIDLGGYTDKARTQIFALRAAPIQVNYMGYPGTMGANYIDYIMADPIVIPDAARPFYSEKIAYLPNSYMVYDTKRKFAVPVPCREDLGLPTEGVVFCCFNSSWKITPGVFDCWMNILKQVELSVLWLIRDNQTAAENLKKEAVARGIAEERLVFADRKLASEHLTRYRCADLFLDTLPYNAHTTAMDALWMGLPVLTCMGEGFASRVAASVLQTMGLPELITTDLNEYVVRAVTLGIDYTALRAIRRKLAVNRSTKPLFNTELFTRQLESAYAAMYERYQADRPAMDLCISSFSATEV